MKKEELQREQLKKIFVDMLEVNKDIMRFQITLTEKEDEVRGLKKIVRETDKAIDLIKSVKHTEILISLYNSFINQKETYFLGLLKVITNKDTIAKWDRTEKGFKLFMELEAEAKAKAKKEYEDKVKEQEMIKKAREEGKKIEMVLIDGKLKPHIVEEA